MAATTDGGTDFTVNIRNVVASPDGLGIGTDAMVLTAGGRKIEIYAGDVSSVNSGVVLIDGKEVSLYAPETFSGDLVVEMVSVNKYRITAGSSLTIEVRIDGKYVYTTVAAESSVCGDCLGLLGNCNSDPSNDFTAKDGTVLIMSGSNATLDQSSIHDIFAKSYQVAQSQSLFTLAPKEDEIASGTGVYLNGGSFSTDKVLCTFSASDVTFEIKFKPKSVSGSSALMSYLNQPEHVTTTFMIRDGKIVVNYGGNFRETSLTVAVDTWYHMSVVWRSSSRLLLIYLVYMDSTYFMDVVSFTELDVNVLRPCGTLTTGQWNMDSLDSDKLRWDFDGVVDEVRIWNKKLDRAGIVAFAWTYVPSDELDLSNYWRFNEGDGRVAYDSVSGIDMHVVGAGEWSVPQWVTSGGVVAVPGSFDKTAYDVMSDTMSESELARLAEAKEFCASVLARSDVKLNCGSSVGDVGTAVLESFLIQCTYDVYTLRSTASSYSTVSALLVLCSVSNGWHPQRMLCEIYGTGCTWKGEQCDVLCVSGNLDADRTCQCLDGFWGVDCEHRCQSSCAGIPCNKASGQCECPLNRDPATNCSTCAVGWHGDDCSSARSNVVRHANATMCLAYGHTSYVMFDGQTFSLDRTREFLFVRTTDIEVFVLQTKCDSPYTYCVAEVAIRSASDIIVIRAPEDLNPAHYTVYVNDVVQAFDITLQLTDVDVDKYPKNSVKVTTTTGLVVKTTSYANYLSVAVIAPLTDCPSAEGACGSCDNNPNDDFVTDPDQHVALDNITANIVNSEFGDRVLESGNVGFVYTDAIRAATGDSAGDFCLYFNHTSVQSPPISKLIDPDSDVVSIETRFKVDSAATSGVLLGYTSAKAFTITTDGTLKLTVDSTVYDLGISADTTWQYLSVSYNKTSGATTVYHINHEGVITNKTINIGTGVFTESGSLAVGAQAPNPGDSATTTYPTTFAGHVDEIRIWNRGFGLVDWVQSSVKDAASTYAGLAAQWSFGEGSGDETSDSVGDITMTLSSEPDKWVVSDAHVTAAPSPRSTTEAPEELKALCVEVIDEVATSCAALGIAIKHSFLMNCFDGAAVTPTPDTVVATAVEYAYYCAYMLEPAALMGATCALESSVDLSGACVDDGKCQLGSSCADGTCDCFSGYWGERCDKECPGGADNPCNGRGLCNVTTGRCVCEATWNDMSDCTVCDDGWSGPDCSEFSLGGGSSTNETTANGTTPLQGQEVATVFGQGHVVTFKNALFKLNALGVFYLLRASSGLQAQVKLVPCYDRSVCVEAVAISHGSDSVVVRSGYTSIQQPLVYHNGQLMQSGNAGVFTVEHKSTFVVDVTRDSAVTLAIKQVHKYLTLTLTVPIEACSNQQSVFGDCAEAASNSVDETGEIWRVSTEDSHFGVLDSASSLMGRSDVTVGGGYALRFDSKTWMATDVLKNVFRYMQDTSIELFVKPESTSGVVASYGIRSTFSVYLDTTVRVQVSKQELDTEIELTLSTWNKVTVVWDAVNKQLTVYVIKPDGIVRYKSFSVERTDFFTKGGTFAIGRWIQSEDAQSINPASAGFVGTIDEIRVWKVALAYQQAQQMYTRNIYEKQVDLIAAWKFDEGEGDVAHDLVGTSHLYFVTYSWTSHVPQWTFSDVPLPPAPLKTGQFFNTDAAAAAASSKCQFVLDTSSLASTCLGATARRVYTKVCEYDIAASGRLDTSLHIVSSVADVCAKKTAATSWPAQSLCVAYAPGTFPYYAGPECTAKCYFRSFDATPDDECRCYNGYHGAECSKMCPGGALNACSKHGVCEQATGACACDANWAGDAGCTTCTPGYIGSDCSVVATATSTSSQRTAAVSVGGQWTLLDGAGIVYRDTGVFTFFRQPSTDLLVEVAQAQCASFGVCLRAIALSVDGHSVVISGNSGLEPSVVYLDGRKTYVTSTAATAIAAGYHLFRTDVYQYKINGTDGFEVIVDIQEYNLDVHLSVVSCGDIGGLVAAPCNPSVAPDCSTLQCEVASLGLVEYIARNPTTQQLKIAEYGSTYIVTYSTSLFYTALGQSWSLRKAFAFDNTTALSMSINNVSNGDLLTIEIVFRIDSVDSSAVLLSYTTAEEMFAIAHTGGRIIIQHDTQTLETGVSIETGVWGMLSLGYRKSTLQVTLAYITSTGAVSYEKHTGFSLGSFRSWGTLVIGAQHGSTNMNLIGAVDRVTIWDRAFSLEDVRYHWQTNIVFREPSVTYMWTMSEGSGRSTVDSQHAQRLYMHPQTTWANSDVVVSSTYPAETFPASPTYVSVTALETARATCDSLYHDGVLSQLCGALTDATSYYYAACLRSVAATGEASSSLDSVLVFASTCQRALGLSEWPARTLCNAFPKRHFPVWIGTPCNIRCIFGHVDPRAPEVCVCDTGYWGDDCSSECPGGATNMCSGHGKCSTDGTCRCEEGWQGKHRLWMSLLN